KARPRGEGSPDPSLRLYRRPRGAPTSRRGQGQRDLRYGSRRDRPHQHRSRRRPAPMTHHSDELSDSLGWRTGMREHALPDEPEEPDPHRVAWAIFLTLAV